MPRVIGNAASRSQFSRYFHRKALDTALPLPIINCLLVVIALRYFALFHFMAKLLVAGETRATLVRGEYWLARLYRDTWTFVLSVG